jgi:orotate phosphoribosyltransferase
MIKSKYTKDLKDIIHDKYLIKGDVQLSSGEHKSSYFDIKRLVLNCEDSYVLLEVLVKQINKITGRLKFNSIIGIELGGALIASQLVTRIMTDHVFGVIRKKPREHGLMKQIEGNPVSPILLIDDVITTSHTVANMIQVCIDKKLAVAGVLCVIDRRKVDKADENLLLLGGMNNIPSGVYRTPFYSIFRESDFN